MITVGIVISLAGNLNVLILAASRVVFAMGENGELPRSFSYVDPKRHVPVVAVLSTVGMMLVLTLSGTFIYLVTLSTISRLVTYLVTCGVARRLVGVAVCVWLLSSIGWHEARDIGIAIAVGLAIYALKLGRSTELSVSPVDPAR